MGYQITFTPTEEKMKEYESFVQRNTPWSNLEAEYADLLYKVFHPGDNPKNFYINLQLSISYIVQQEINDAKRYAYNQWKEEKEVYFCGWEYDKDDYWATKESITKLFTEEFFKWACIIPTSDYYDELEKWDHKYTEVLNQIQELKDEAYSLGTHIICAELAEFKVGEDDE